MWDPSGKELQDRNHHAADRPTGRVALGTSAFIKSKMFYKKNQVMKTCALLYYMLKRLDLFLLNFASSKKEKKKRNKNLPLNTNPMQLLCHFSASHQTKGPASSADSLEDSPSIPQVSVLVSPSTCFTQISPWVMASISFLCRLVTLQPLAQTSFRSSRLTIPTRWLTPSLKPACISNSTHLK